MVGTALIATLATSLTAVPIDGTVAYPIVGPGNQTTPSISGNLVAYADDAAGSWDVWLYDLSDGARRPIATGSEQQDEPSLFLSSLGYREDGRMVLYQVVSPGVLWRGGGLDPAHPTTSAYLLAWDQGPPEDRDIAIHGIGTTVPGDRAFPMAGVQHHPSAWGQWVAFVDDSGQGAARVLDTLTGAVRTIREGRVLAVAAGGRADLPVDPAGGPQGRLLVAVSVIGPLGDADIEIYDENGALLREVRDPGDQVNPHLSDEWLAYEDRTAGGSQLMLLRWTDGVRVQPPPGPNPRTLNHLSVDPGKMLRVAFVEQRADLDIGVYTLALPYVPSQPPQARCDDPASTVLASIDLVLGDCGSEHADRQQDGDHSGDVTLGRCKPEVAWNRFEPPAAMPVLVCIDAERASAAWVSLNGHLLAMPRDFDGDPLHLERGAEVDAGTEWVSAFLAAKPGATLRVRVLAGAASGTGGDQGGTDPEPPPVGRGHHGCDTAGGAPMLALLGLLGLRRGRRQA